MQAGIHEPCGDPDKFVVYTLDATTLRVAATDDADSARIKFGSLLPENLRAASPEQAANDQRLRRFMAAYGAEHQTPAPDFRYGLVDLNGDGVDEAIAWLEDQAWCGSGGCNMLVLARRGDDYEKVSSSTITWPPIQVLPTSTNGWRDLSVFVSGGGLEPHDAILRFDGRRYPPNPSSPPAEPASGRPQGEVVIPLLNVK